MAEGDTHDRVTIDGVAFDPVTEAAAVDFVMSSSHAGRGGCLITPNVDILRQLRRPALAPIATQARLVVADGMPVVWASRLLGSPLPERVTGASLIWTLSRGAAANDRSIFLLGGDEGVAEQAAARLTADVPGLRVAGTHYPPYGFERDPQLRAAIDDALDAARPDVVFVGLGFPKQEKLMIELAERFPAIWFVGCGASIAFAAGAVPRAPMWAQRSGLEWLYRLAQEPRRLARRYLVDDIPYTAGLLARAALRGAVSRRRG